MSERDAEFQGLVDRMVRAEQAAVRDFVGRHVERPGTHRLWVYRTPPAEDILARVECDHHPLVTAGRTIYVLIPLESLNPEADPPLPVDEACRQFPFLVYPA